MRRLAKTLILGLLSCTLVVPALVSPAGASVRQDSASSLSTVRPTRLVEIRASHHSGIDRVVFEFDRGLPTFHRARYVSSMNRSPSNLPLRVPGRAILSVNMRYADGHDYHGRVLVPQRSAFALPNVMTVVRSQDFEAVLTFGIGLAARRSFTVSTLTSPSRVVVTIGAGFSTKAQRVYFLDQPNFVAGQSPYATPVKRPIRTTNPAVVLLDRLFAGPTARERHDGLRLVRSHATGFTGLRIANGIARVQLTGGCNSGGSTFTIANEIVPTLRRLPTVDFVKIYDPLGGTADPTGKTNSIPACLEP